MFRLEPAGHQGWYGPGLTSLLDSYFYRMHDEYLQHEEAMETSGKDTDPAKVVESSQVR